MLDYIVSSKRDPSFTAPLYLIPTAINYDRVLEDRVLTDELLGKELRATRKEKLSTTFEFLFKNLFRSLLRRFKRYGYAIVAFGEPILIDDVAREDPTLFAEPFEQRKPALTRLANRVMQEISDALPVTPVTLVATIFAERTDGLSESEMLQAIDARRAEWRPRVWLLREHAAADIWKAARHVLELRHLIEQRDERWQWVAADRTLLEYYANAVRPFDQVAMRGWPERRAAAGESRTS
jgi:glycerol-3-phosphate O-acyltransferase